MTDYKTNFFREYNTICKDYTYTPFIIDGVDRIVVFGDIHGDYKMAIKLLLMSGVAVIDSFEKDFNNQKTKKCKDSKLKYINDKKIDDDDDDDCDDEDNLKEDVRNDIRYKKTIIRNDVIYKMKWTGGKTHVVQVGDQVDRCRVYGSMRCELPETTLNDEDSDVKVLKLFTDLDEQAVKVGGRVISLLGNHELNNALGNMDYVSYKGIEGFDNYKDPKTGNKFSSGLEARKHAFHPGNELGVFLGCTRNPAVIIGSNLFVHAGFVNKLISEQDRKGNKLENYTFRLNYNSKYYNKKPYLFKDRQDFENINILIKRWLLNKVSTNKVKDIITDPSQEKSIFWTRILGMLKTQLPYDDKQCVNNIDKILELFKINNIIVGHTPQSFQHNLNINATCDNKIWRVDTGSSAAFDRYDTTYIRTGNILEERKFQYLEILNDNKFKICYEDKCENAL